ncbi:histidine kinase [Streptomyces sp. NPDC046316]|uniref:ATP-binding protein n=1 Tax=Streptomyces sp. NPDC046316 TaxID=3154494 RepID=UPI0034066C10
MGVRGDVRGWWVRAREFGASRPQAVDVGIALLVQAAMTMPFVVPRPPGLEPATWAAYGLTSLTVVPLIWRRRAPVAVLLAIMATSTLYQLAVDGPGQPLPYTGLVIVYTIAALSPPSKRLATVLLLVVAVPVSVWLNTRSARELTFSLFVFAAAYVFGRLTDARQRAARVETERAAARERARIAREMHDILSHAVSLMIVQAEAGPVAVRTAPERAEAAFDAISATGRDAMGQLRRMLGVLREGTEGPEPREPQPDLGGLPGLLERVRAGGLDVAYGTTGGVRTLPAATGATVYRIVQEALTNVVKHAEARTASVRLAYEEGVLEVVVTDDGRGPRRGARPGGGGHGLVGIRERAAAHKMQLLMVQRLDGGLTIGDTHVSFSGGCPSSRGGDRGDPRPRTGGRLVRAGTAGRRRSGPRRRDAGTGRARG